ncbi:phage tail tape measure protein [Pseudanabaena sp. FACHB-2040]|uniref:phage tail tape measure protein n=1 Tax=Pseudanabaena sp. FACHB-2040 TaxID=2692859 RepID=UPI00168240B0|nr:phage tail tape measure protein [Pseudanabaena sp. FACHB-2040]MBD2261375.1 phage tail tape measure protein [Pseudanabaena sp. FACHB-2040]
MSVESLQILLEAVDQASQPIQAVADSIEGLTKLSGDMKSLGQGVSDFGQGMVRNVTLPIVAGLGEAARVAIEFESVMADLNKAYGFEQGTQEAAEGQRVVKKLSMELGRMPTDIAAIGTEAGKLGVKFDQFEDYTRLVTSASVAFDMSAQQAGESIGVITNVLGYMDNQGRVNIEGLGKLGDAINFLADSGATSESAIIGVLQRAGGTTRTFGLASESAAALAASFLNLGYPPEVVGTALNGMLPMLQNATQQTSKFQQTLEDIGLPAAELEKMIKQDAVGAIDTLLQTIADSGDTSVISKMFGTGSDAAMMTSMVQNLELFRKTMGSLDKVEAGSMMDTFAKRSATTAAGLERLRATTYILRNEIGSALLPAINSILGALTPLVQKFATFAEANPQIVKMGIALLLVAAAIGPIAIAIGGVITTLAAIPAALAGWQALMLMFASGGGIAAALGTVKAMIMGVVTSAASLGAILLGVVYGVFALGGALMGVSVSFGTFLQTIKFSLMELPANLAALPAAVGAIFSAMAAAARMAVMNIVITFRMMVTTMSSVWAQVRAVATAGVMSVVAAIRAGASAAVSAVTGMGSAILASIRAIASQAFAAGRNIVTRIADGIRSGIGAVQSAVSSVAAAVRSFLPNSPVPEGPLTILNNLSNNPGTKIVEMLAAGMAGAAGTLGDTMGAVGGGAVGGLNVPVSAGGGSAPVSIVVQVNGVGNAQEAEAIGDSFAQRVRQVLSDVERQKARVSYG